MFDWFRTVDDRFSTYNDDSEISRLNRDELAVRDCHPDVRGILARCDELCEETSGFFDAIRVARCPVDPSGLVKGWSVDRAGELLEAGGIGNYSINAAGDIRTRGGAVPDPIWRTGIEHPRALDRIAAVVEGTDLAIATSGEYARGHHIVDPHTGRPPEGLLSVTIVGARPRDGRRLRDRGVRDGRGRAGVDGHATGLRGALHPRGRLVARHGRVPVRASLAGVAPRPNGRRRPRPARNVGWSSSAPRRPAPAAAQVNHRLRRSARRRSEELRHRSGARTCGEHLLALDIAA